jgi:transcriptional regulator with XRE-family HTH domain
MDATATNAAGKGPSATMNKPTLGTVIQNAREAQGLSLRQLARLIGVNPSQVLRWETGEGTPTPRALAAVADQLELRASELFKLAGVPVPSDVATLPAMLRADYDLPPEAIAEVEAHIAAVAKRYRGTPKRLVKNSRTERRET